MKYKELDAVFSQVDQVFKEVDKTFKTMEQHLDDIYTKYSTKQKPKWETYTLKWPKCIHGKWYWPGNKVWRKVTVVREDTHLYTIYTYGNEFDVLKDAD